MQQQQGTDELPQATKGANGAGENTTNYNTPTTKEPLSDPMQHLIITPLHCICKICMTGETKKVAILPIQQHQVRKHFKNVHANIFDLGRFNNVSISLEAAKLLATKGGWKDQIETPQRKETHTVCTACNATFGRKSHHFKRHTLKSSTCNESTKDRRECVQLICGGWFPIPTTANITTTPPNQQLQHFPSSLDRNSRMPKATCTTLSQYEIALEPFVAERTNVGSWAQVLLTAVSMHGETFGDYIKTTLEMIFAAQKSPDPVLAILNKCADMYADCFPSIVTLIPGNILGTVQNFNSASIDDSQNYRSVFSARHSYARVKSYFHHLFAFLFVRQCPLLQPYIDVINENTASFSVEDSFQYAFIPCLLYDLAREVPPQLGVNTWLLEHAQLYCFRLSGGQPILDGYGWGATKLSSALHAVRAGVCGMMITEQFTTDTGLRQANEYAKEVRDCVFVNIISRWICWLREQDKTQMNARSIYYDPMENIIIDGIMFKKEIYSNLIPRIYQLFHKQFELFFKGDEWKHVLDLTKGVEMINWYNFDFKVEGCNPMLIELNEESSGDIEKLCALLELSLFGLGLGSSRLEQVSNISTTAFAWGYDCLYYGMTSRKRGSIKAKSGDLEEHKLPLCIERCLFLTRLIFANMPGLTFGSKQLFPTLPSKRYTMMHLVRSIFELKPDVGETIQVRHLFHSILNILYPDGVSEYGLMITMPGLCEMCHHSPETGRLKYSGKLLFWKQQAYFDYHFHLGDRTRATGNKIIPQSPCLESDLLDILKMVFGADATFRSKKQKEAMLSVLNKRNNHHAVLLGCGAGKTLLALAPTLDAHMRGRVPTMTILVAPHINLVGHQQGHIQSLLSKVNSDIDNNNINVEYFTDFGPTLPPSLSDDSLPHIVVVSITAFARLLRYHSNKIQFWYEQGKLGDIFVDEIQLITSEGTIRTDYEYLQKMASIGAPVTVLSGSLSSVILGVLANYLGLTSSTTPINIISANDLVGDHFNFEVRSKPRYNVDGVVDYAKQRVRDCHIHILCATTRTAEQIYEKLKDDPTVSCITGQHASNEKMNVADQWRRGEISVLISTTCALVGNENGKCRHIMIVDQIYDLSNLLQAMGRLRVEQGGQDSFVTQFLSEEEMENEAATMTATTKKINDLRNMGLEIDDVVDEVKMQLTPGGYSSLFKRKGCLLKNLSDVFGGKRDYDCKRCTNCDYFYNTSRAIIRHVPAFLQPKQPSITDHNNNEMEPEPFGSNSNDDAGGGEVDTPINNLNSNEDSRHTDKTSTTSTATITKRDKPPTQRLAKLAEKHQKRIGDNTETESRHTKVKKTSHQCHAFKLGGNPRLQQLTSAARKKEGLQNSIASEAETKLRMARKKCFQCKTTQCDGVQCFVGRSRNCYNCFGQHYRNVCPFKVVEQQEVDKEGTKIKRWVGNRDMTNFMSEKSRGCVICFDPECTEISFDPDKPHQAQKRIKGALFKKIQGEETFLDTVKRCYATTESRNIFLAGM